MSSIITIIQKSEQIDFLILFKFSKIKNIDFLKKLIHNITDITCTFTHSLLPQKWWKEWKLHKSKQGNYQD